MYITKEDIQAYNAAFNADDTELKRLIHQAQQDIDNLTYYRIQARGGLERFSEFIQGQVKTACCEQVMFLQTYGDMVNSPLQSYGINGVSMTLNAEAVITRGGVTVSRQVYNLLLPTGLMYRGIG